MRLWLSKNPLIISLVNGLWKFRSGRSGVMFIILRHLSSFSYRFSRRGPLRRVSVWTGTSAVSRAARSRRGGQDVPHSRQRATASLVRGERTKHVRYIEWRHLRVCGSLDTNRYIIIIITLKEKHSCTVKSYELVAYKRSTTWWRLHAFDLSQTLTTQCMF